MTATLKLKGRELAKGLRFPEGPVAMADGSVLLVEIERGTLSRVDQKGRVEVVAQTGGGPDGARIRPGGQCRLRYKCRVRPQRRAGGRLAPLRPPARRTRTRPSP